jgi:hypothetical protein
MAYTATKYFSPRAFPFPAGFDNTQKLLWLRGAMVDCDTATEYTPGGVGSTSFQVTAFSAVGLVTFDTMKGVPLVNGQTVVVYNTASNDNDGTYTVSQLTYNANGTSGTFVAVPILGKALNGTAQTSQTAEGVGQIQFGQKALLKQTFTASAVVVSGGFMKVTYTTLTGPQLWPGDKVTIAGMTNAGNNGTFSLSYVFPTGATGGSFWIINPSAVATDSGTGTGSFDAGNSPYNSQSAPVQVKLFNSNGYVYVWNAQNQTIQVFTTGTASTDPLNEAALGANVAFESTLTFEALLIRAKS